MAEDLAEKDGAPGPGGPTTQRASRPVVRMDGGLIAGQETARQAGPGGNGDYPGEVHELGAHGPQRGGALDPDQIGPHHRNICSAGTERLGAPWYGAARK